MPGTLPEQAVLDGRFERETLPGRDIPPARTAKRAWVRTGGLVAAGTLVLGFGAAVYRAGWAAAHVAIPVLAGQNMAAAAHIVLPLQLGVVVTEQRQDPRVGIGVILAQDPPPGREVLKGSVIRLTVSQGSGIVPDLHRLPVSAAVRNLEAVGLRLGRVSYTYDDVVAAGNVIHQVQARGAHLDWNGPVDVLVSQGPPPAPLPAPPPVTPPSGPAQSLPAPVNDRSAPVGPSDQPAQNQGIFDRK